MTQKMVETLADVWDDLQARQAGNVALSFVTPEQGKEESSFTFGQLKTLVDQAQSRLECRLKQKSSSSALSSPSSTHEESPRTVALCLANSLDWIVWFWTLALSPHRLVVIDPSLVRISERQHEFDGTCLDVGVDVVICEKADVENVSLLAAGLLVEVVCAGEEGELDREHKHSRTSTDPDIVLTTR